ncbi:MAG TPA: hypothetical protein VNN80_20575 [Polyangiaceae bacterium]|nr:hypothetical protein [Polyangiaceae bacterium]
MKREDEFDIDTDDAAGHASARGAVPRGLASRDGARGARSPEAVAAGPSTAAPVSAAAASAVSNVTDADDAVMEVGDDEIETAEPNAPRTLPSPAASTVVRSRPPAPPSMRPRSTSALRAQLPPPRHLSSAPPSRGPVSSRPPGVDPWVLANRNLELGRANLRVATLQEQLAFREARIAELEEALARTQRKLEALEQRLAPAASSVGARASEAPVVTETRPAFGVPSRGDASRRGDEDEVDGDEGGDLLHDAGRESDFGARTAATGSEEDLQQISGIGPRFEAALRRHGVTRVSQIAAWSDADVRQVAKALRIPKSRIVKGRWVEVAREVVGTRVASE